MKTYRIRPRLLTRMELDKGILTYRFDYGVKVKSFVYFWYIEGAEKNILVDTGADAKTSTAFRGFPAEEVMSFEEALASLELTPGDIDLVIQTHLHWDHCVNTSKCQNARVLVQEDELRFALATHPVAAASYKRDLLKGLDFVIVNGRYEVAPGIELIPAPGHSPGCQAVAIDTEKGKAVISGFCCLRDNFEPPEEMRAVAPVITPGTHIDAIEAFESALRIKGLADILIPQHDPAFAEVESIP